MVEARCVLAGWSCSLSAPGSCTRYSPLHAAAAAENTRCTTSAQNQACECGVSRLQVRARICIHMQWVSTQVGTCVQVHGRACKCACTMNTMPNGSDRASVQNMCLRRRACSSCTRQEDHSCTHTKTRARIRSCTLERSSRGSSGS